MIAGSLSESRYIDRKEGYLIAEAVKKKILIEMFEKVGKNAKIVLNYAVSHVVFTSKP
jgi:hypothetical protein